MSCQQLEPTWTPTSITRWIRGGGATAITSTDVSGSARVAERQALSRLVRSMPRAGAGSSRARSSRERRARRSIGRG